MKLCKYGCVWQYCTVSSWWYSGTVEKDVFWGSSIF